MRSAPIRCELQVVSLDENPYYEVLSYVWGDPTSTKFIYVDEQRFYATVNLFDFLYSLRHAEADRYLWADAICIDQSDEEEKSHQIGLMTKIYRQANEAHVWFGHFDSKTWFQEFANDDKYMSSTEITPSLWEAYQQHGATTLRYLLEEEKFEPMSQKEYKDFVNQCRQDVFLQTLSVLGEMGKDDHLYTYPVVARAGYGDNDHRCMLNRSWLLVMDCIRWLVTRQWWTRVWTMQEASLPRVDPTVHAPPYSFKLSHLLNGVESMCRHNDAICCKWYGQPVMTSNRDDHEYGTVYTQCRAIHGQRRILAEADEEGLGVPLGMVVSAIQGRNVFNVRDRWFGTFGLLSERWQEKSRLHPSRSTVAELFSQFSNILYMDSTDLTHLDRARRCKASEIEGLPSWAIDLSDPRASCEQNEHHWELYNACDGICFISDIGWLELRSSGLNIKAIHVSSIQACAKRSLPSPHTVEDVRKLVNQWMNLYQDTVCTLDADAFWRTVFMDRNIQTHWLLKRVRPLAAVRVREIKQWWTTWENTSDHRDLTDDRKERDGSKGKYHYKELQMNVERTNFFVTSQGLPGMGPHEMKPGDEVYAIAGCKALVVLRPPSDEQSQGPTVVGLCFVDRWMYGRALQGRAIWKAIKIY